jgi:hypothetical protein
METLNPMPGIISNLAEIAGGWYTPGVPRRLVFLLLLFAPCRAALVSLSPPPGWEDVTASRREENLLVSLKGPQRSSFVLTRIGPLSMENRGALRAFLLNVLREIEARAKLGLRPASNLNTVTFANDLTVHYIRADIKNRPRLILAVAKEQGVFMLGTLISPAPQTLLASFMGSLKFGPSGPQASPPAAAAAETLDGQLAFSLPAGVSARALSARERKMGVVAVFSGLGSELMLMKILEEGTPVSQQADIVRDTALSVEGAQPATLVPAARGATPAGPDLVFASVKLRGGQSFAAGYMPWGYWGYSALAKGPAAVELLTGVFGRLSLGSSAVPKLVAATPKLPLPERAGGRLRLLGAGAAVLLAVVLLVWRKRAK